MRHPSGVSKLTSRAGLALGENCRGARCRKTSVQASIRIFRSGPGLAGMKSRGPAVVVQQPHGGAGTTCRPIRGRHSNSAAQARPLPSRTMSAQMPIGFAGDAFGTAERPSSTLGLNVLDEDGAARWRTAD